MLSNFEEAANGSRQRSGDVLTDVTNPVLSFPMAQAHSTPLSKYSPGHQFMEPTDAAPDFFSRPIETVLFKPPTSRPPLQHSFKPDNAYNGQRSAFTSDRLQHQRPFKPTSIYDKTFARGRHWPSLAARSSPSFKNRTRLAAREGLRREEKSRYAQLFQQFTSTPLTFGSGHGSKSSAMLAHTNGLDETTLTGRALRNSTPHSPSPPTPDRMAPPKPPGWVMSGAVGVGQGSGGSGRSAERGPRNNDTGLFKAPGARPPLHPASAQSAHSTHRYPMRAQQSPQPSRSSLPTPLYEKAFTRGQQWRSPAGRGASGPRSRHKLAVRESIRLEEKTLYAQLLQQFTTTPLPGTAFGSGYIKRPGSILTGYKRLGETPLGTTVGELVGARTSPARASQAEVSPAASPPPAPTRVDLTKTPGSAARAAGGVPPGLTDRALGEQRARRVAQARRLATATPTPAHPATVTPGPGRTLGDTIDLTEDGEEGGARTSTAAGRTTVSASEAIVFQSPRSPASVEFEKAVRESACVSEDWLDQLTTKFSADARRRERLIKEDEIKVQYMKQKRAELDEQLETRIRQRLRLSEREQAVVEEEFPKDEEEDVEEAVDEFPALTEEQEAMVDAALRPYPSGEILTEGFRLQLTRKDIETLGGLNWLNDEVINFYMNLLMERGEKEGCSKVHAFNTFFYPKLMSGGHAGVRRWTRRVDVLAMDYMLVPVHLGMHWCLAVVDFKKKEIRYYDSMGGRNQNCLEALRQYLMEESMDKKKQRFEIDGWNLINVKDIPQQMNGSDCGMFTCKFAEYITRDAPVTFTQDDMPYFRRRIVYEILTKQLL